MQSEIPVIYIYIALVCNIGYDCSTVVPVIDGKVSGLRHRI